MQDREDGYRPPPRRRRGGGKWSGRGGRRLRNEGWRDSREQHRGRQEETRLSYRELEELLDDPADDSTTIAGGEAEA